MALRELVADGGDCSGGNSIGKLTRQFERDNSLFRVLFN